MRILVVSERFWPEGSGGTLATYLITKLLATVRDFKITVITGSRNPAKINNVKFVIDEAFRIQHKPLRWLYFFSPTVRKRYKDLMKRFDIIYIPYGYPLIPLAKELDKKVIVHLHDYQPVAYNSTILYNQKDSLVDHIKAELVYELFEYNSLKRAVAGSLLVPIVRLCRIWVSKADIIICVSQRQAAIISRRAPELAHKIKVIYNPLPEVPYIEEKFEKTTFAFAGGGSFIKGFHVFIQAALRFLKRGKDVRFLLTGGLRGLRREHAMLLNKLNNVFTKRFVLLGHIPYESVLKTYSRSYAVLVPSIWEEPLPYVVMESMAMGTIPIASKIGGIPEIVKDTYAEEMLFTPGNIEEVVNRMEEVLSMTRSDLNNIGLQLREIALKKFDQERIKHELLRTF